MTHPWIGADEGTLPLRELSALVLPEPPLSGAGGVDCWSCGPQDDGWTVWEDDLWRVRALHRDTTFPGTAMLTTTRHATGLADLTPEEAATFGVMCQRVTRALLSRDGGEHVHVWFFPRPLGYLDLRGSYLVEWEELLPAASQHELRAGAADLRARLAR